MEHAIARLRGSPGGRKLCGIRFPTIDLERTELLRGITAAGQAGLAIDLLVGPHDLAKVQVLAASAPGTSLIIDHLGDPPGDAVERNRWQRDLAGIAALPNTSIKVSGAALLGKDAADVIARVADIFTADRMMFGSDWPITTARTGYGALLTSTLGHLSFLPLQAVLNDTAVRVYSLRPGPAQRNWPADTEPRDGGTRVAKDRSRLG